MRPSHSSFWRPALGLLLALATAPASAYAQGNAAAPVPAAAAPLSASLTGMARAEYEAGKLLYQDGDFQNALVKFQSVYDLSHDGRLLWNIAVCEKNLRRYTRVLTTLDRYLVEAGSMISADDRQEAKDLAAAAKPLVSVLWITVSEPGAEILIDDTRVGTSPLAAGVKLDLGKRRIHIQKAGFKPFDRAEEVAGGTELAITATLEKEVHVGRLVVKAGETDLISIDGNAVAQGKWDGKLSSGGHTLRVTSPGMTIYQSEVIVQDNKPREIQVTLTPLAKASNLSKWLWIAGGAVLVTGAAIGGAVLSQPKPQTEVTGTLGTVYLSLGGRR